LQRPIGAQERVDTSIARDATAASGITEDGDEPGASATLTASGPPSRHL
jgi:hypothetical protein